MSRWNRNNVVSRQLLYCPLSSRSSCFFVARVTPCAPSAALAGRGLPALPGRGVRRYRSNVQKPSRSPVVAVFLDRKTMKRDRFHVSPLLMTGVVQLFTCDFRFQKICFAFLIDLRLTGSE